jgi:hypothetical protein
MGKAAVLFVAALGAACSSPNSPSPAATSPPPPSPSQPSPTVTRYSVTGVVTDEIGSPVAGAVVEVDYSRGGDFSSPPAYCPFSNFCWIAMHTDGGGNYAFAFDSGQGLVHGPDSDGAGVIYSFADGYEANIQLLPRGTPAIVANLRLRRVRPVNAGESVTLTIEADSSLCSDLEDWWLLARRCENIEVVAGTTGRLTVDARAADAGGTIPVVFFATSGRYTSIQTPGPGTVSVGVEAGQRYRVYVGLSGGTVGRYDVTTSVR